MILLNHLQQFTPNYQPINTTRDNKPYSFNSQNFYFYDSSYMFDNLSILKRCMIQKNSSKFVIGLKISYKRSSPFRFIQTVFFCDQVPIAEAADFEVTKNYPDKLIMCIF